MLTDDELDDLYLPSRPDSHHAPAYIKAFARAVIAAYGAKLREQEPVAWTDETGYVWPNDAKHIKSNMPLYLHPAPSAPETKQPSMDCYIKATRDGLAELDPIERLRFFLSIALTGQDWIDVEPFIDALAPIPEGWQPISTAPKDGITILAKLFGRRSESTTREVLWNGENWITRDGSRFSGITHWMKLPAPPMTTARSE